jgi:hypothetical protein
VPPEQVGEAERAVRAAVREELPAVSEQIRKGRELDEEARSRLLTVARTAVESIADPDG